MKATLVLFACLGLGMASASANDIVIFKRTETVAGNYNSESTTPPVGLKPSKTSNKDEFFEVIDLTAKQRKVIRLIPQGKKFEVGSVENTIGYTVMPLKVTGTFLWYRGAGQAGQAEADYGNGVEPGFDFFPDASGSSPAGDGVPDYFSTWYFSQAETGKAGPVKLGAVTLTVPTTISILGDAVEQFEDTGVLERGAGASTVRGSVVLDRRLSTRANNDAGSGTLAYGETLVRGALAALGYTELVP